MMNGWTSNDRKTGTFYPECSFIFLELYPRCKVRSNPSPPPLIKQIKEKYKPELVIGFQEAIRRAIENRDFEFCKQIPVKYSNAEILIYFENLDTFFQREGIYKLHSS